MSISEPFIRRPVATTLLMIGLALAGLLGYRQLPVAALPQVDYPTILVSTTLPGASPETMASAVTTPLERQFGQMPSLTQMTSVSSFAQSQITLQFALERSIDAAEQDVQAAMNAATNLLPQTLPTPPTYSKSNPADTPVITLALSSETLPIAQVSDYGDSVLAQKISQVAGVGLVTQSGGQKPAVRVQVDPVALAGAGLTLEDVRLALVSANVNQLWFANTSTLQVLRNEGTIPRSIGTDASVSAIYRPKASQNIIFRLSGAVLNAGSGFRDLFASTGRKTLFYSILGNAILAF